MALTYLTRTPSSGGNRKIFTFSAWIKRSKIGVSQSIIGQTTETSGNDYFRIIFDGGGTTDQLRVFSSNGNMNKITKMKFRDTSAWYHIVCAFDTTQSTASNRNRIYVNGVEQTSFATDNNVDINTSFEFNITNECTIGRKAYDNTDFFDGSMSHIHFIDGTQYAASNFGSVDSTTGEWQINTSPSVTYGTNGFFILKDGNSVTDQSGEGNNFTVGGSTLTKTEDNPSNVFATFNPLNQTTVGTNVYSSGNTDLTSSPNVNEFHGASTLGMTSGKYYAEFKMKNGQFNTVGITSTPSNDARTNVSVRTSANSYGLYSYNGKLNADTYASSYTAPNVIGVAVDLDNNKIYFSKDGNWSTGSGAWGSTTWSAGTGAYTITDPSLTVEGAYFFAIGEASGGSSGLYSANFGNGYFGTTAVSSAGTNASGIGIFEYDVPTGYTALSTKGLNL